MSLYSVVVPVMNEEGNVNTMYERIKNTFTKIGENFELIFVDDGSTDDSFKMLEKFNQSMQDLK